MGNRLKNIAVGIGSAFALIPAGDVAHIQISSKTDAERIHQDWQRVGQDMRKSMGKIDVKQKEKART